MLREIIKSSNNTYTLNLPDELVGKTIEVIAFKIEDETPLDLTPIFVDNSLEEIRKKYSRHPAISHKDFKFNRDEANHHSE